MSDKAPPHILTYDGDDYLIHQGGEFLLRVDTTDGRCAVFRIIGGERLDADPWALSAEEYEVIKSAHNWAVRRFLRGWCSFGSTETKYPIQG